MTSGDTNTFNQYLTQFVSYAVRVHDIAETELETSYHLFVLGLLASLDGQYQIISDLESEYGHYYAILLTHTNLLQDIIIEFTNVSIIKKL